MRNEERDSFTGSRADSTTAARAVCPLRRSALRAVRFLSPSSLPSSYSHFSFDTLSLSDAPNAITTRATMSSDAASLLTVSSSTPLVDASTSAKVRATFRPQFSLALTNMSNPMQSPSFLSKLLKRSPSPRASESSFSTKPPPSSEDVFREVMTLDARHGHPSVQALSLKTPPRTPHKPKPWPSKPAQSSQDIFDEVMRLNAKHGHPSVQALSVR
ncbi:hypothetical protein DMC30DRAFT_275600 [Rhodotorula diobovata]|uniref:Uncharacterized protein n=1 Tax=Rhodotorula diobovata TaxID=5288 RepID=A0A5C5FT48_9BASI|nr:hypothetical protein DMC30DRAFT_275600 [Rhodotorula diobovata]